MPSELAPFYPLTLQHGLLLGAVFLVGQGSAMAPIIYVLL